MQIITALLLALPAAQAAHSPWARSKPAHARHARSVNASSIPKFKYMPAVVNTAAINAVASTWFAGWHGGEGMFTPANVSWSKYTSVAYAFAETTPNISDLNVTAEEVPILRELVTLGHRNNVNVTIAIGGWTGSRFFSSAVATAKNRTLFVNAINRLVQTYSLDGINIDWEYPNNLGIGCNTIAANDTANLLLLLKELRTSASFAKGAIITAAVGLTPFMGPDGTPSADVSEFAKYLDHIEIMNYDVWGSWSDTAGPNAPLNDTCVAKPTQAVGSAVSGVKAWTDAGIPASQIVLAVGSYGHSFSVNKTDAFVSTSNKTLNSFPSFNAAVQPLGDQWDDPTNTTDVCGNPQAQSGVFDFFGLIDGGFLTKNGTVAKGIEYSYDACSQTPFVYNATSGVFVSYDDARSFEAKGAYITTTGLKGFAMWEAAGDYNDILLDAIRSGAGFPDAEDDDCDAAPISSSIPTSTSVKHSASHTSVHATATASVSASGRINAAIPSASASSTPSTGDDDDECEDDGDDGDDQDIPECEDDE